jgi:hypothetical protein
MGIYTVLVMVEKKYVEVDEKGLSFACLKGLDIYAV